MTHSVRVYGARASHTQHKVYRVPKRTCTDGGGGGNPKRPSKQPTSESPASTTPYLPSVLCHARCERTFSYKIRFSLYILRAYMLCMYMAVLCCG